MDIFVCLRLTIGISQWAVWAKQILVSVLSVIIAFVQNPAQQNIPVRCVEVRRLNRGRVRAAIHGLVDTLKLLGVTLLIL